MDVALPDRLAISGSLKCSSRARRVPILLAKDPSVNKTISKNRQRAYEAQARRCYYCKCLMWLGSGDKQFRQHHSLTRKQAQALRCTAEHLHARCDGGGNAMGNIVAACLRCNGGRHQQKKVLEPNSFVAFVEHQIARGEWHGFDVGRHRLRPV